jgi:hypothetical protein
MLVVGVDSRPYTRLAYEVFAGRSSVEELLRMAQARDPATQFYANLYLALFAEAKGLDEQASICTSPW